MGIEQKSGICPTHGPILLERETVNHLLHFFLCIPTAGLWMIVWAIQGLKPQPWICPTCGQLGYFEDDVDADGNVDEAKIAQQNETRRFMQLAVGMVAAAFIAYSLLGFGG